MNSIQQNYTHKHKLYQQQFALNQMSPAEKGQYSPINNDATNNNSTNNNVNMNQTMGMFFGKMMNQLSSALKGPGQTESQNKSQSTNNNNSSQQGQSSDNMTVTVNGTQVSEGATVDIGNGMTATIQDGSLVITNASGQTTTQSVQANDSIDVSSNNGAININDQNNASNNNMNQVSSSTSSQHPKKTTGQRLNLVA